jgi:hypothetical protein
VLVSSVPKENMDVPSHPSWQYTALPFEFLRCTLYNKPANVNHFSEFCESFQQIIEKKLYEPLPL